MVFVPIDSQKMRPPLGLFFLAIGQIVFELFHVKLSSFLPDFATIHSKGREENGHSGSRPFETWGAAANFVSLSADGVDTWAFRSFSLLFSPLAQDALVVLGDAQYALFL